MKSVIVLCFILVVVEGARELLIDRIRSRLVTSGIGNVCATESGANEDDIAELTSHKLPSRRQGKCLVACIFERLGVTEAIARSHVQNAAFNFLGQLKETNSLLYDTVSQIVLNCGSKMYSETSSDPCEVAFEVMSCGLQEGLSKGVENVFGSLITRQSDTLFPGLGKL